MTDPGREVLRSLIEHIPGVVYRVLTDEARTPLFLSGGIETLTGYPASEFLGELPVRTLASVLHPDDTGPAFERVLAAGDAGGSREDEFRVVRADGQVRWVLATARAARDEDGRVVHIDGTMFDITDRRVTEEELRSARDEAEAATRAKSEFLARMSHELRSPLNAILGFVDLVVRDPELGADHCEKLGVVKRSGRHLLDMIEQVLTLSRLEAEGVELVVDPFDLVEALEDVVQITRARAEGKGLRFSLELDPGIAPCVVGDAGKIRQVLTNLLGNAVRYTTEGGIWLRARTAPRAGGPSHLTLELDVADTGPGIPKDQLDRIFQHFVRGDEVSKSDSGVGLGLAISRSLVSLMDGEIAAASELGHGSLFKVRIPVRAGGEESAPALEAAGTVSLAPGQPEWRILVVEDGVENRLLLRTLLEGAGFTVREAENGEVGVEVAREWRPHLIWMDLRMPVMDGYAAARAIRAGPGGGSAKIVALSAGAGTVARSAVLDAGCDDLVGKPLRAGEIFERMARLLDLRYRDAGPGTVSTTATSVALTPSMLAELPADHLESLRSAALLLDRAAMESVVAKIARHAPTTALALTSLIRRLRTGRLLELLAEGEEEA